MFAGIDVAHRNPLRGWTAIASFTAQAALVGAALVYSIYYPQTLSNPSLHPHIFVPMQLRDVQMAEPARPSGRSAAHPFVTPLIVGRGVSLHLANEPIRDTGFGAPPRLGVVGTADGILHGIGTDAAPPVFEKPTTNSHPVRLSKISEGMLVRKIEPRYPPAALLARIDGPVKIKAIISREGIIEQAQVLSGNPLLTNAALEAIRQWRYRPYILNGEAVEVETEITVNFILGH